MSELESPNSTSDSTPTKATKAQWGGIVAAIVAGLGTLQVALDDNVITASEWVGVAVATLVGLGAVFGTVYGVTNRPK